MSLTASRAALLHVALQDLRAGKALLAERLPAIADSVRDEQLRAAIAQDHENARRRAGQLDALAELSGGPANIWMTGILDDAARDARSHLPGEILDTALIGALRKAKAAEIVSFETALALAAREAPTMVPTLRAIHEEDRITEATLAERLAAVTGAVPV